MTTRIAFARPPAQVTIGEGLSLAARYWAATVERWILAVAAVALVSGLTTWLFTGSLADEATLQRVFRMSIDGTPLDPAEVPRLIAGPLAASIVTLVAGWFLVANAVAGLRGRDLTMRWVLSGGLRSLATALLIGLVVFAVLVPLLALGALGALLILAGIPVSVYLFLRIAFWTYALFDGEGIGSGGALTWRITRGAVLRIFGWNLLLGILGFCFGVVSLILDVSIGSVSRPLSDALTGGLDATLSAYTVIVLAILYESQRGRRLGPEGVAAPPRSPFDPPPPPGPPWG